MQALDQLNKKVDSLLKKYAALESENKRLKDTIAAEVKKTHELNRKLASLERSMVSVHIGKTVDNEDEQENMRQFVWALGRSKD